MPTFRTAFTLSLLALAGAAESQMTLTVDAADAPRRILHATLEMPAEPGPMDVYYVEWTPGNHNPSGPIQNVVNFEARDDRGRKLEWKRDPTDTVRKSFVVPEGARSVTLRYSYILNQPSVNSRSTDSYGLRSLGALNWNTVLFEPGGADKNETTVDASIQLPTGWTLISALPVEVSRAGYYDFAPVSFAFLVDSPAIFGEYLATWEHEPQPSRMVDSAPHFTDAVASEPEKLVLSDEMREALDEMLSQTVKVFGPFPYRQYRFLTVLDSDVPGAGLEHTESTYISLPDDRFVDGKPSAIGVFPHEYIHAWNGKLRAPEGLLHENYHTDGDATLLWVYEGLTSYYDDVLMARSGMMTAEEYVDGLTGRIEHYQQQAGRLWKSVEDTAAGQRHLRAGSPSWEELRRRQDYYSEGALFWMAADAIIRAETGGGKSLDDFTRAFFDVDPIDFGAPVTYTRQDVVDGLTAIHDGRDWDAMIREFIERPVRSLEHPLPGLLNRDFVYASEPTEEQEKDERSPYSRLTSRTLGFAVDREGEVQTVLTGTPGDRAGMSYGMTVLGVNGWSFTPDRLRDAIERTSETGRVELIVRYDDRVEGRTIVYSGGVSYPRMELREGEADILTAIIEPR